jgi:hypothetical protein
MFPPVSFCPPVQENQDRDVGAGVSIGPGRIIEQLAENLKECGAMCNLAQNHSVGTADAPPPTQHGGGPLWRQNDSLDALLEREEAAGDFRLLVTHAPVSWLPIKPGKSVYYSGYLLYQDKSTNTDACGAACQDNLAPS